MKGKLKKMVPVAVLALTCSLSAGVIAGCGEKHTHDYTKWGSNETQHWKECPEDGEKDENSFEDHLFVAGECECGKTEQTGPVVEAKYGTVSGTVRLYKQGVYMTDKLNGIQVDMGDDDVEISGSVADGKYSFKVENVQVNKNYTLTVSNTGYQSYSTEIELEEEGEEAKIGGTNGITLNYNVFGYIEGYDTDYHDLTHVNDAEPYIVFTENPGGKTFNVLTNDRYNDVSASLRIKYNNSGNGMHTQGILLKFEDGKHLIVRYHNGDMVNGNIQYCNAAWASTPKENSLFGEDAGLNEWGEHAVHTLLDAETAAIKADGLDLKLVLKGGTLYTFFDGNFITKYELPDGYADKKVQIGYFAWDSASNAIFNYDIDETVPEMQSVLNIDVTNPADGTECTVTAEPQKDTYNLGEEVELTFTAPDGYKLDALTVGGKDMIDEVSGGKVTIKADEFTLDIEAVFVKEEPIALELSVKGTKLGSTEVLADGTTVTFKNTSYSFTVENGKITNPSVPKGRYTVQVSGYFDKEITFNESLTEVVLEKDTFKQILNWGNFNFDNQNAETPSFGITNDCAVILTNETYGRVMSSIYLKGNNQNAGNAGLVFRFVGNGMADNGETVTLTMQGTRKVQFSKDALWDKTTVASGLSWNNLIYFENCYDDDMDRIADEHAQEYLDAYAAGTLKLSVLREGSTFYVYLNDRYIGQQTVDAKYADAQCEVGFFSSGLGNTSDWKYWNVGIDANAPERASATVTDGTATDANGSLTVTPEEAVKIGDEITVTIAPENGYKLDSLTVGGVDVTGQITGTTYKFIVAGNTTIIAEFTQIIPGSINAQIVGYKFGVAGNSLTASATATLSASGFDSVNVQLTAADENIVLSVESIPAGKWTLKIDGYKSVEITIAENGEYTTEIALQPEIEFELVKPWGDIDSVISADGSSLLTIGNEFETAITKATYGDIAATAYLGGTNMLKEGNTGTQGIVFRFSDNKFIVLRMEGRAKIQFAHTGWYQDGGNADGLDWQDLKFFTDAGENTVKDKYLTAFDKGELKLTAVRKGATVYAILTVDGVSEIIGSRTFDAKYLNDNAKVGMFCEGTVNGALKTWKFEIGDADAVLATATTAVGTDKTSYLGSWTDADNALTVTGKGLIEFKADAGTVKESVTIKISAANGPDEQGIIYRFADGKYVAIRYQNSTEAATPHGKVQFTMDTVLHTNASLVGWGSDYALTEDEKTAFDGAGLDLTFVRDGNKFYVLLGERVMGSQTVDETAYATADGNMGIMMWNGKGVAFAYEHKTGDSVTVPVTD